MSEIKIEVVPVVLSGGSGTRLWPLSRKGFPKQFLCFAGEDSLFQQAAIRLRKLERDDIFIQPLLLVTGEEHRFLAAEQLREVGIELGCALLEPIGRNTAPALTLAALAAQASGRDPILVVTPADQVIINTAIFVDVMQVAIREAVNDSVVVLGITPDSPETGYGYIKVGEENTSMKVFSVERFIEKPDSARAQSYLDSGNFFWNAGIFVLKASVWLTAISKLRPNIFQMTCDAWKQRNKDGNFIRPGKEVFKDIPSESIDFAVMEHSSSIGLPVKMVSIDAGWSDLGAWDALWKVLPKDDRGNAHIGDVLSSDSNNTLVYADNRLVSLVGVENLIVVETTDAVLVVDRARSQDVKNIVKFLHDRGREEHILHRKVYRPWGWYNILDQGGRFKVKRIQVKPKASLSLQKHHHRAEHWIVVTGTAEIINGDKILTLTENQSTYIPLGEVHRLSNPGNTPLEIIEVQSGSYLGEDDIVRYEDSYGRKDY